MDKVRGLTSRCSGQRYREPFKRHLSFAVVLVLVGHVASAALPLSSGPLGRRRNDVKAGRDTRLSHGTVSEPARSETL
jgi:hypothetical protein